MKVHSYKKETTKEDILQQLHIWNMVRNDKTNDILIQKHYKYLLMEIKKTVDQLLNDKS